jgi:hypothetical protein
MVRVIELSPKNPFLSYFLYYIAGGYAEALTRLCEINERYATRV